MQPARLSASNPHLLAGFSDDGDAAQKQAMCTCGWRSTRWLAITPAADEWEHHVWLAIRGIDDVRRTA